MKTHYRKVFKSDHLGVADLEEFIENKKSLVFTIREVKSEFGVKVAGREGNFNIAYFEEQIKPLVLNVKNSKIVSNFCESPFVEDWINVRVELYIDNNVKFQGDIVSGVRIKPVQPKEKIEITPNFAKWEDLKKKVKAQKMTIEQVRNFYRITEENYKLLCS